MLCGEVNVYMLTVCRFAREPSLLQQAGDVLLNKSSAVKLEEVKWLVSTDAFDLSDDETRQAIYDVRSNSLVTVDGCFVRHDPAVAAHHIPTREYTDTYSTAIGPGL